MELKNWRVLCDLQNWKFVKSPKSRKAQERSLNQVCKWHKQGQKIIIDEVFQVIVEREDQRKDIELLDLKEVLERQVIRTLATHYKTLKCNELGELVEPGIDTNMTLTQWFEALGLVNKNYTNSKKHPDAMYHLLEVDLKQDEFNNILSNNHATLKRWVGEVFDKLAKNRSVVAVEQSFKLRFYNNNEDTKHKFPYIYRNATYNQVKFIKSCEGVVLDSYSTNLRDVLNGVTSITRDQFYFEVVTHIRKKCTDKYLIKAYDHSITSLKALRSYYSTVSVSLNPLTINRKVESVEQLLEHDIEVLKLFHEKLEQADLETNYLDIIQTSIKDTADIKKDLVNTVTNRISNSAIKRLDKANSENVIDTVNKLHLPNAKIVDKSKIDEFNKTYWGEPNPFDVPIVAGK